MPLRAPTPQELEQLKQEGVDIAKLPEKLDFPEEQVSVPGAVGSTLTSHAGGIAGGGLATLGLAAAPFTEGLSLLPSLLLYGIGGTAGSMIGQSVQNRAQGEEVTQRLAEEQEKAEQQHPIATTATDIIAGALASGGAPNLENPLNAGRGLIGKLGGRALSEVEKQAMANMAIQGVVNPAINAGISGAMGQGMPSLGSLAAQGLGGMAFSGHGLSRLVRPETSAPNGATSELTKTAEQATPEAPKESPFTQKNEDGTYAIDDKGVNGALKELFPRPDTKNDDYVTKQQKLTEWRKNTAADMSADEKRQLMHDMWLKKQGEVATQQPKVEEKKPIAEEQKKEEVKQPDTTVTPSMNEFVENVEKQIKEEQATKTNTPTNVGKEEEYVESRKQNNQENIQAEQKPLSDFQQYIEAQKKMKELLSKGQYNSDEFRQAWKDAEDIKNKNGGMPPKEVIAEVPKEEVPVKQEVAVKEEKPPPSDKSEPPSPPIEENKEKPAIVREPKEVKGGWIGSLTRSTINKIRDLNHPLAKAVGDAFYNAHNEIDQLKGRWVNKFIEGTKGLSDKDDARLAEIFRRERDEDKLHPEMLQNDKQKNAYDLARQLLKDNFNYRLANKEPVIDQQGNARLPKSSETYSPTVTNPKIAEIYRTGTDKAEMARLDRAFLDHQESLGVDDPTKRQANLDAWKKAIQGNTSDSSGVSNGTYFNASRRAEGYSLPEEFTRIGWRKNLETYFHRQAVDNAYYKNVESNPKVMSALGETKDAWNRPIEKDPTGGIAGNSAVRAALNEFKGEHGGAMHYNEKALSSLATTLFIGPGTEIHKVISNAVGMLTYADNPYQLGKMLSSAIKNFSSGLEHAKENGIVKLNARSVGDVLDGSLAASDRLRAAGQAVRKIYTLNDLTEKLSAGMMQAGMEQIVPSKIARANRGDADAVAFMKNLDPSWSKGKVYDAKAQSELASNLVRNITGTGDARTMPAWMTGDSEVSGFFKLSHWSIAQTNRFYSDILTPAKNGNYTPLINSIFGAAVGGYAIKELREKLQGKKGQIPSLSEIAASSNGISGNKLLTGYNLMAAASYAGFGGMLSQMGKVPLDWIYKNNSQGMIFPLDEVASDTVHTIREITTAMANDPNFDWFDAAKQYAGHLMTNNFQLGRVIYNQAIDNGIITGTPAEKKALSDKLGELRRFEMVEGLPYNETDNAGNEFMDIEQKKFKLEQDPQKAIKMLPGLINGIMEKYKGQPDVMMSKLEGLKQNSYATMPSMETMPLSFMKYVAFLEREEGPEKAHEALQDYMRHKVVNEAKASVVP